MRNTKRTIARKSLVLALCTSLCGTQTFPVANPNAAKAGGSSVIIIKLKAGKSKTVKFKKYIGKIKYKLSKAGIVKLSKKTNRSATIKGLKKGKTNLIVKCGSKKYIFKIIVKAKTNAGTSGQGSSGQSTSAPGTTAASASSGQTAAPGTTAANASSGQTAAPGTTTVPMKSPLPIITINPGTSETGSPDGNESDNSGSNETSNPDASESDNPGDSSETTAPGESANPSDSSESTAPGESANPGDSDETSTPGESANPGDYGETTTPKESANPGDSGETTAPGQSSNPAESAAPEESSTPVESSNPSGENQPSAETIAYDAGEYSINNVHTGDGTFYDRENGGAANLDEYEAIYYTAAMNNEDYMNGLAGAYIEITDKDGDVVNVLITDRLPEGKKGDIDLTRKTFNVIEPEVTGRMDISWKIIPLPTSEPISYLFKPTSTQWWAEVQVRNHRYPIAKLEYLDGSGNYVALERQEYNYFTASSGMGTGPFTFRVTDIYGHVLIDEGIQLDTSGTPVAGQANFPY